MRIVFGILIWILMPAVSVFCKDGSRRNSGLDDRLQLTETYFEPKSFGFMAIGGGSSHVNWVLTILDEMINRGHNATFFAPEDTLRFGRSFPRVELISFGPEPHFPTDPKFGLPNENNLVPGKFAIFEMISLTWKKDFITLTDFVQEKKIDVLICDSFFDTCADVARYLKKPFIITSSMEQSKDSAASYIYNHQVDITDFTSEFQSLYKRFLLEFVKPFRVYLATREFVRDFMALKKSMGITGVFDFTESWKDSIKLINDFYDITPPRWSSPLVEHVGVIIPRKYTPLNDKLKEYLDNHLRVVYIAFGQHARASLKANTHIMTSLLELYDSGNVDGILWSTSGSMEDFPLEITTSSKNTHIVKDFFEGNHPDIRFEKWVPQLAVLLHPSTYVFVSHGGMGSISESLYAGKRMAFFPFFGDQPGNAKTLERKNVGRIIKLDDTVSGTANILKTLVIDADGLIAENVKRMQAIVQIRSRDGPRAGATILEEVAFTHINGKIPHRYEASRRMSFVKAHNIDIYLIFIILISTSIALVGYTAKYLIGYIKSVYSKQIKSKTA